MASPRSCRYTPPPASRGKLAPTADIPQPHPSTVGAGLPAMASPRSCRYTPSPASRGKLAPTADTPALWERACPRWHQHDPAGMPRRLNREASSLLQQTPHTHTPPLWERACPRWHQRDPAGMPPSPASRGKIAPCNPGPGHRYYKRHLTRTGDLSFPETGFSALTRNRLR